MYTDLIASGIVNGSQYALLGVAFALIFGVTGRFHFAFGFVFTASAYAVSLLQEALGGGLVLPLLGGLAVAVLLGGACELLVYRPVADNSDGGSLLTVFVSALGLTVVGTNAISLFIGPESRTLEQYGRSSHNVLGASVTSLEVVATIASWMLIAALGLVLRWTPPGRAIRAVRTNPQLARTMGLPVNRLYLGVFGIGSVMAAVGAVISGMRFAITPDMGVRPVLFAFVIAFLGGTMRGPFIVGLAGLGMGLVESLSRIWLSSQWSALVVFAVLFVYLCLPTSGPGQWLRSLRMSARSLPKPRGA